MIILKKIWTLQFNNYQGKSISRARLYRQICLLSYKHKKFAENNAFSVQEDRPVLRDNLLNKLIFKYF